MSEHGDVTTGLTAEEEQAILPKVLGVSFESQEYLIRRARYYAELTINIPLQGASLQVGKIGKNIIKPADYLKFKYASIHPWVAENEASSNAVGKKFYIHDPELEVKVKQKKLDGRKASYKEFIKLTASKDKMLMVTNLLGTNPKEMAPNEIEQYLEDIAINTPDHFLSIVNDKNLEMKAFITDCVSNEALAKIGTTYLEGDEPLGSSMEETVLYLNDKANSDVLARLKAKLSQFKKS